jgi:hypothetical protein
VTTRKDEYQDHQVASDYDALNFAYTEPRAHYRSVSYRIDMLHVLDKKMSAAIIYQVVFRWLTYRQETILREIERRHADHLPTLTTQDVDDRMWISLSYNDFVRETGGAISYNTVVAALEYLVTTKGVLRRRTSRNPRFSDYEYSIERQRVHELLAALPETPHITPKGSKAGPPPVHSAPTTGTVQAQEVPPTSGSVSPTSGLLQAQEVPPTSGSISPTSGLLQAQEVPPTSGSISPTSGLLHAQEVPPTSGSVSPTSGLLQAQEVSPTSGSVSPTSGLLQAQEVPPTSGSVPPTSGLLQAQEVPPTSGSVPPTSGWGRPTSGPADSQKRDPLQRRTDSFSQRNTLQQQQRGASEKRSAAAAAPMISPQPFSQDDIGLVAASWQHAARSTSTASQQHPLVDAFIAQALQLKEQASAISGEQPAGQAAEQALQLWMQASAISGEQPAEQAAEQALQLWMQASAISGEQPAEQAAEQALQLWMQASAISGEQPAEQIINAMLIEDCSVEVCERQRSRVCE